MKGKRWTAGLATAVIVAACSSERVGMPTDATHTPYTANLAAPSCPDTISVKARIKGLFLPGNVGTAMSSWEAVINAYKHGDVATAQSLAVQLYAYTKQQYDAGNLVGALTPAGAQAVAALGNAIFCNVAITVHIAANLDDNAFAVVPAGRDTIIKTGTTNAGVHLIAAQQLPQTVVVITRLADNAKTTSCAQFTGPLCTPLAQFPPFYDYQLIPAPNLGASAPPFTVEECVDTSKVHVPLSQLFLAHNVTNNTGTNAQLLPRAAETLGLACDNSGTSMAPSANVFRRFASALSDFLVTPAYAATGSGTGITGKTKSFSPFGIVDANDFVAYLNGSWAYHAPTLSTLPPAPGTGDIPGFESPSFTLDGTWVLSASAFGNAPFGSADMGFGCALNQLPFVNHVWPTFTNPPTTGNLDQDASTIFLLRNTFFVPSSWNQDLQVGVAIDNDVEVFVNGTPVTPAGQFAIHEGCAAQDAPGFVFAVPQALLAKGAMNVLAIRARDRGGNSYIDARLSPVTPLTP